MQLINEHYSFTGMQRDGDISQHQNTFLFEGHNIRLTSRNGESTLLALTNEKGTKAFWESEHLVGIYLGHCVLNNYLVVFSHDESPNNNNPDYIVRIKLSDKPHYEYDVLFNGNLNFDESHKIDAIGNYENESIQKVYWVDGKNQPRVINIADTPNGAPHYTNSNSFDFIRELELNEEVSILKEVNSAGSFAPGVIQYAFTYYTKYGQESNIFYTSPLLYTSHWNRGGSPDSKVANTFRISIKNIDTHFDFLRIYSIQRTSLNGTPIAKRVQDISIEPEKTKIEFVDTGTTGNSIDYTELLYKGGQKIIAKTLEQKDNTLFLGNITLDRPSINSIEGLDLKTEINEAEEPREIVINKSDNNNYVYGNQLNAIEETEIDGVTLKKSVPCGGFKYLDYYRCGIQFQYKDGSWSEPVFIADKRVSKHPKVVTDENNNNIKYSLPSLEYILTGDSEDNPLKEGNTTKLYNAGYRKARAVVVFPEIQDRVSLCQGVLDYTLKTNNNTYHQSSWFFRPRNSDIYGSDNLLFSPKSLVNASLEYIPQVWKESGGEWSTFAYNANNIRKVEIQGTFNADNEFIIIGDTKTFHSPDIEFDDSFSIGSLFDSSKFVFSGYATFSKTLSDISLQTDTPPIKGIGFDHKEFAETAGGSKGIITGLFYCDWAVDDDGSSEYFRGFNIETHAVRWPVYPWHRSGSINNDFNRPSSAGQRTAVLKRKVISNLRYSDTSYDINSTSKDFDIAPKVFNSDQVSIIKTGYITYEGNIDTLLQPDELGGIFFATNKGVPQSIPELRAQTFNENFTNDVDVSYKDNIWKGFVSSQNLTTGYKPFGLWYNPLASTWESYEKINIGDYASVQLITNRESVRMKYKSSPHLVFKYTETENDNGLFSGKTDYLPIIDIVTPGDTQNTFHRSTMFGGTSEDALRANNWIPCGEPVKIVSGKSATIRFSYGDTYYQRWDCLKTYPFSPDDTNQIVEIGSFMLETRVNIDGRYDDNRGQVNNTNVTRTNFNLLNKVYSQVDNFFTYKILPKDYYSLNSFPNQITWTKEKQPGSEIDLWTNITLASTYNVDGAKGGITSLNLAGDNLLCFQDKALNKILFNSRVQIPVSDGVPIEISNNYKCDGHVTIGDGVGCSDKWLIKEAPSGVYFIDSVTNHLYLYNSSLLDISSNTNMSSWFVNNSNLTKVVYDEQYKDIYIITPETALCYSELLTQFTSLMDYGGIDLLEYCKGTTVALKNKKYYSLFEGEYNKFFEEYKPWGFSFISNGSSMGLIGKDKIFDNIEYELDMFDISEDSTTHKETQAYSANKTFSNIKVENEYQDTEEVDLSRTLLPTKILPTKIYAGHGEKDNLQKKFRIWRVQVPRNKSNNRDRIRNPWCKITFSALPKSKDNNVRAVLHDLNVKYYI